MQEFTFEIVHTFPEDDHVLSDDILVYIVNGSIGITMENVQWRLNTDDIVFIPAFCHRQWQITEKFNAAVLMIKSISEILSMEHLKFNCNSAMVDGTDYSMLKKLYADFLYDFALNKNRITAHRMGLFYLILDELEKFGVHQYPAAGQLTDAEQLSGVLGYIHQNYSENLTLEAMGERFYMSPSVFSRYFKKMCGVNFADYLMQVRLQYACEQLKSTRKRITDIAVDCGFSMASSFNKFFKKACGVTPGEYRQQHLNSGTGLNQSVMTTESEVILQHFLENRVEDTEDNIIRQKVIADAAVQRSYHKVWNKAVNVGAVAELLSGMQQKHVLVLQKELGFQYLRVLNVFSREMHIRKNYDEQVNYDMLDNVLDFLVEHQIGVILDMGNKRKAIVRTTKERLYELDEPPVFKNLEDAISVIDGFIVHIINRYGIKEISSWIFEITFEEQDYGANARYSFRDYYMTVLTLIKRRLPEALTGVYTGTPGQAGFEEIKLWGTLRQKPDFISISALPYRPKRLPDGTFMAQRSMDPMYMKNAFTDLKQQLFENGLGHLKIFVTEWNLNISDRNCVNDSQEFAAQLLEMINDLMEAADLAVYTFGSDLTLRYFESSLPFFGGKGLLSKDGLFKPSFYALSLYSRLENKLIQKGKGYMVTAGGPGHYTILCYNAKAFTYVYYHTEESQWLPESLDGMFSDHQALDVSFYLCNIADGEYSVKSYILNKTNSVLTQWTMLGKKDSLNREDIDYLNKICIPRIKNDKCIVCEGRFNYSVILTPHEIRLIQIDFLGVDKM